MLEMPTPAAVEICQRKLRIDPDRFIIIGDRPFVVALGAPPQATVAVGPRQIAIAGLVRQNDARARINPLVTTRLCASVGVIGHRARRIDETTGQCEAYRQAEQKTTAHPCLRSRTN